MTLLIFSFLVLFTLAQNYNKISYEVGTFHTFKFEGNVDHLAQPVGHQAVKHSTNKIHGEMEMVMQRKDGENFVFAMNLYFVEVEATDGTTSSGSKKLSDGEKGLGPDMFFTVTPDGQILSVWHQEDDLPFFVQIKSSVISSLQTKIVDEDSKSEESDLVGSHQSLFAPKRGLYGATVTITKTFSQNDFVKFADPRVSKSTFEIKGKSVVVINPHGHFQSSVSSQDILFVKAAVSDDVFSASSDVKLGYDSNLKSTGFLKLQLQHKKYIFPRISPNFEDEFERAIKTDLFSIGSHAASLNIADLGAGIQSNDEIFSSLQTEKTDFEELRKVGKYLEQNPSQIKLLTEELTQGASAITSDSVVVRRWLYILSNLNIYESNDVLRNLLDNKYIRREVLKSLAVSTVTDCSLLPVIFLAIKDDAEDKHEAIIAFGSIARKCPSTHLREKAQDILINMRSKSNSDEPISYTLDAAIYNMLKEQASISVVSDYPYNKSYSKNIPLGGELLSADFDFEAFLGTNFDCNQNSFNYKASALATAKVNFLGNKSTALRAEVIYGAANGQRLANEISVIVFDNVIYRQPIPSPDLDCSLKSHNLLSESTGFSVSYTVWVSIVPVTFKASLDASIDVTFQWKVCDLDLSALVQLVPTGTLGAHGSASSSLYLVEGGIKLGAEFDVTPKPSAFINGTKCEVGLNVQVTYDPMVASVDVWYRTQTCRYWVYDCKWGNFNNKTLWKYDIGGRTDVLFNKTWLINSP